MTELLIELNNTQFGLHALITKYDHYNVETLELFLLQHNLVQKLWHRIKKNDSY